MTHALLDFPGPVLAAAMALALVRTSLGFVAFLFAIRKADTKSRLKAYRILTRRQLSPTRIRISRRKRSAGRKSRSWS